jgi:hypothetical protein
VKPQDDSYEAPSVELLDTQDSPAITAAGVQVSDETSDWGAVALELREAPDPAGRAEPASSAASRGASAAPSRRPSSSAISAARRR